MSARALVRTGALAAALPEVAGVKSRVLFAPITPAGWGGVFWQLLLIVASSWSLTAWPVAWQGRKQAVSDWAPVWCRGREPKNCPLSPPVGEITFEATCWLSNQEPGTPVSPHTALFFCCWTTEMDALKDFQGLKQGEKNSLRCLIGQIESGP